MLQKYTFENANARKKRLVIIVAIEYLRRLAELNLTRRKYVASGTYRTDFTGEAIN